MQCSTKNVLKFTVKGKEMIKYVFKVLQLHTLFGELMPCHRNYLTFSVTYTVLFSKLYIS